MEDDRVKINLCWDPDDKSIVYGQVQHADHSYSVNVLPPGDKRSQIYEMFGYKPVNTYWLLYVDGREIGRVRNLTGLVTMLTNVIAEGLDK